MIASHDVPAITVIIPAFNAAPWLPMLMDSLDQQAFRDFEVVFVNDGSTDNTEVLLSDYAADRDWVKVIHQVNGGVGAARNTGISASKGHYIVFVDADDAISESHLDDLYSLATSLDLDVAMCNGWHFYKKPGDGINEPLVTKPRPERIMSGMEWFETTLNDGEWWGIPWMTMVRRDFLNRYAIYFEEGIVHEDILWNAIVQSKAKRLAYTPKQSYYYRQTPDSVLNNKSISARMKRISSYIVVIEKLFLLSDVDNTFGSTLFKRLAMHESRILLALLAELGSFRLRIAISHELRKRELLIRLFREVETGRHRKRIARSYWFAWLGMIAESLKINEPYTLNLDKSIMSSNKL